MQQQKSSPENNFRWWVSKNNIPEGPFSEAYIVAAFKGGAILAGTLICPVGENQWKRLSECLPFAESVRTTASAQPLIPPVQPGARRGRLISLFTNPRLPRMANWICVYCLVINPLFMILCLPRTFSYTIRVYTSSPSVDTSSPMFVLASLWDLMRIIINIAVFIVLVWGGLKLKKMKQSGRVWALAALYVDLSTDAFIFLGTIFFFVLADAIDPKVFGAGNKSTGMGLVLMELALFWALTVFRIVAVIWLHRHGRDLPIVEPSR